MDQYRPSHVDEERVATHLAPRLRSSTNTENDGGIQLVWERIFQHTMEQSDVYQQSAYDRLCHISRRLGVEGREQGAAGTLIAVYDSLVEERDILMRSFDNTQLGQLTAEVVEEANRYKAKVKAFYINVQALEDSNAYSPAIVTSPLSNYRFPTLLNEESGGDHRQSGAEGPSTQKTGPAHHNFAYSALGLYNLEPPAQRFGGSTALIHDEQTELAQGVLAEFNLSTDVTMTDDLFHDEPQEMEMTMFNEPCRTIQQGGMRQEQGTSQSMRPDRSQSSSRASFETTEVPPLRLRTFRLRTRDTLDEEHMAVTKDTKHSMDPSNQPQEERPT
ncbi:hypothetical protein BDY19DRAFT_214435 [Irpex rosettiformis]|uniref:Uncharacterized protein n=1 Tax=Irpex rosettiformis TaxID=378272 RepID=A0ACB8U1S1_9APHY|nr:hypothetical protein BDY19DRAFT_214435 [Irpex rosettiformis]